jgi:DNA-binding MarR family transcriptional regulator
MEVDEPVVLRLLTGLRECSRHVERGVANHPLDEIDVGLLALAAQANGMLRPSQAAEALDVAFPSVTRHVQGLQRAGHVMINLDPDDRRSYRIALTDDGAAMLHDFRRDLVTRFTPVVEGWDPAELAALADGLDKLATAMRDARTSADQRPPRPHWWRAGALEGKP